MEDILYLTESCKPVLFFVLEIGKLLHNHPAEEYTINVEL